MLRPWKVFGVNVGKFKFGRNPIRAEAFGVESLTLVVATKDMLDMLGVFKG